MLLNVFDVEVEIGVPVQELEYSSQLANVPREPPLIVKSTTPAAQSVSFETFNDVGSFDDVASTISIEIQLELLHLAALI